MSSVEHEKRCPWWMNLRAARERCKNRKHKNYAIYGGRGILCDLTPDEAKFMWFRDKADNMKIPTLDRIDRNGNYTITNCRFIEMSENSRRARLGWRKTT